MSLISFERDLSNYFPHGERPVWNVIRENLDVYIKESGKSLYRISRDGGFHDATILKRIMLLDGHTDISNLQRLAKGLGIKTIDLFEDWSE